MNILALLAAALECADDLEAELKARYAPNGTIHPAEQRRYKRDIAIVEEVRTRVKEFTDEG